MRTLILCVFLVGCATKSPLQIKQEKLYDCTYDFIKLDVGAEDAANACIKINKKETIRNMY